MSKGARKTFSREFRHEAAQLVVKQGYTLRAAAESMRVGLSTMDKWFKQLRATPSAQSVKGAPVTPEQQRVRDSKRKSSALKWRMKF